MCIYTHTYVYMLFVVVDMKTQLAPQREQEIVWSQMQMTMAQNTDSDDPGMFNVETVSLSYIVLTKKYKSQDTSSIF